MSTRVEDDLMASIAGATVLAACGGPKRVASAAGVDESNGRRYGRGEPANPVNRVRQMIEKARDPWSICAYLVAVAIRAELSKAPMTEWRWRSLYVQALESEAIHDGPEDQTTQRLLMGTAGLSDMVNADTALIAPTMRRLALSIIGMQNGWSVNGARLMEGR